MILSSDRVPIIISKGILFWFLTSSYLKKRRHEEPSLEFETSIPSESQMTFLGLAVLASEHAHDGLYRS